MDSLPDNQRIVLTGVGLTSPLGDDLPSFRTALLEGRANIENIDMRYMGIVHAGVCHFDAKRYQSRRELRNSTRVGSVSIYCAREAVKAAGLDWDSVEKKPGRRLPGDHRARQRGDRERGLQHFAVQLRHALLDASPQSPHGGQ